MAGEGLLFLGSNLEPRLHRLLEAERLLVRWGGVEVLCRSAVYETEPVVRLRQPWFLNRVLRVRGPADGPSLLALVQRVEAALGRRRGTDKGPRTVDVDILDWKGWALETSRLVLPHPAIPQRRCILVPLREAAPDWRHPRLGAGAGELLGACADRSAVRLFLPVLDEEG